MSAFLVDELTIDGIITEIARRVENSAWMRKRLTTELDVDLTDAAWQTMLGRRMLDLNQKALNIRYGDLKSRLSYQFQQVHCSKVQAFKSLQCWRINARRAQSRKHQGSTSS